MNNDKIDYWKNKRRYSSVRIVIFLIIAMLDLIISIVIWEIRSLFYACIFIFFMMLELNLNMGFTALINDMREKEREITEVIVFP